MRILIVGGGFGGVKVALGLAHDKRFAVTVLTDKDHFLYYPALYGTATGRSHLQSSVALSEIFKDIPNVTLVQDKAKALDVARHMLIAESGKQYEYDKCVLALGVVTTYFGIEGLAEHTYGIKSIAEVERFKTHLHDELTTTKHMDKNYVIVGAGPTGVELSAALMTYLQNISRAHHIRHGKIHISLVEAAPRVLPRMSEASSAKVTRRLQKLGVKVMTGQKVEAADDDSLMVNERTIPSQTVVWTSGVTNNPFFVANADQFHMAKNGRVEVDQFMQAAEDVFVIGDNAATPYTGLAQTALHDGIFVAKHLKRIVSGNTLKLYRVRKPPVVVPVGPHWALFEWGWLRLTGWPGAFLRRAADFVGYNDILPFGQALGAWRAEYITEEDCVICAQDADSKAT